MDQSELKQFKDQLILARDTVASRLKRTESDGRETDADGEAQDLADRAANSYTKELLFSKSSSDRQFLQMLENAIEQIEEGSYGECDECGEVIGLRRLQAIPWARLCIKCQELEEQGKL